MANALKNGRVLDPLGGWGRMTPVLQKFEPSSITLVDILPGHIELAKKINDMVSVPQTYVGGCGGKQDINALIKAVGPIGVGVGSEYVFRGKLDAVLINYYRA